MMKRLNRQTQDRLFKKKVTVAGTTMLHHRYIYRGYLQIAALDLTRSAHPALWLVTWDPSQPTATRPLALQKDGTWFTYGYDTTKSICEVFGPVGYIRTAYSYAPFGAVTESGDVSQPFQWSSEVYDSELDLVYYNYRHYSPSLGRFLSRDPIEEQGGLNLYGFVINNPNIFFDEVGTRGKSGRPKPKPLYPGGVGKPVNPRPQQPPLWACLIEVIEDIFFGEFAQEKKRLENALILGELYRNGKIHCEKEIPSKDLKCVGCCVITVYVVREFPARFGVWSDDFVPGSGEVAEILSIQYDFYSTPCGLTHFAFAPTPPIEPIFIRHSIEPK